MSYDYASEILATPAKTAASGMPPDRQNQPYNYADDILGGKESVADKIPGVQPAKQQTGDIVSSSVIRGAAGLAGMPVDALNLLRMARNKAQGTNYPGFTGGSQDIVKGIETVTGTPLYKPEGNIERMASSVIEGAASGPFSKASALIGGISGAGGEIAGRLTDDNPWARAAGALFAGGTAGLLASLRKPTGSVINDLLQDTTEAQLKQAQQLVNSARAKGITLTGPEAIAQIKGTAAEPILGVQRVVEQSRGGGPTMAGVMAARPEQNRQAFGGVLSSIAPQVADPTTIAPRVQAAAESAIDVARQAGNAKAAPFYAQASGDVVAGADMSALMRNPVARDAVTKVLKDPFYGVTGQNPNSVAVLDAAKKYLDDVTSSAQIEGLRNKSRIASGAIDDILKTADLSSPAYPQARAIVQKNMREVVEPMQQRAIGQLAEAQTFPAQRAILFPSNPETLTPAAVREAITKIRVKDKTAAQDLTRQFLQTQFDEVTQNLVSGGNTFGGAKFAAAITGNSKQAENIKAAIEATGGKQAVRGFTNFIEIMEAQGKRQASGSMTEFNKQITEELSRGGAIGQAVSTGASPGTWLTGAKDWYERVKYSGNAKELADIFVDPQTVRRMYQLAMMNPGSERAKALATVIAVTNSQAQNNQQ